MNLRQLTVFREVMKTGSLSQAARNLHRTQPAISSSLKALETDLGMSLFSREGRRLVPVPEAHYLMSVASDILGRVRMAEQNLSNMKDRISGSLRIVAMPGPSSFLLPDFLSAYVADRDHVRITIATRSSPQIHMLVAAQSFDVGFCDMSTEENHSGLYNTIPIPSVCVCALHKDHPLTSRAEITATDLDNQPMGALQPEHSTFRETVRVFQASGSVFNLRFDAQYFLPLLHFVEAGTACVVIDAMSAESYRRRSHGRGNVVFRPFRPEVEYGYSILTPKHQALSFLAASFVDKWQAYVESVVEQYSRNCDFGEQERDRVSD